MNKDSKFCSGIEWVDGEAYVCGDEAEIFCKTHERLFCARHVFKVTAVDFAELGGCKEMTLCADGCSEWILECGCKIEEIAQKSPA